MDSIQAMTVISLDSLHDSLAEHSFTNSNSFLISSDFLPNEISYGLTQNRYLVILLPSALNLYPVKIGEIAQVHGINTFTSVFDGSCLDGIPFVFLSSKVDEQIAFLDIFCTLAASEDYQVQIVEFIELLVKANKRRPKFHAPSFFAELVVVTNLVKERGNVVESWQSSGNSVFDIIASENFPAIEIKSTTCMDSRIHTLSLHQIRYFSNNPGSLLASVQVAEDSNGITCRELSLNLRQNLLVMQLPGVEYIDALLVSFSRLESFNEHKFCLVSTTASIKFLSPDFGDLDLLQPPPYVVGAKLKLDFDLIPNIR